MKYQKPWIPYLIIIKYQDGKINKKTAALNDNGGSGQPHKAATLFQRRCVLEGTRDKCFLALSKFKKGWGCNKTGLTHGQKKVRERRNLVLEGIQREFIRSRQEAKTD